MRNSYFLDTSYAVALTLPDDAFHVRAAELSTRVRNEDVALITTRVIPLEIGNALSKPQFRTKVVRLLDDLCVYTAVTTIELTDRLYKDTLELFRSRPDKSWGMVDCLSFVVMHKVNIGSALTADRHFQQAGFRALLREEEPIA